MAKILSSTYDLRPCLVARGDSLEKALFHCWGNKAYIAAPSSLVGGPKGGQMWCTFGIVELENGAVVEVPPGCIQFLDPKHEVYAWPPTMDL